MSVTLIRRTSFGVRIAIALVALLGATVVHAQEPTAPDAPELRAEDAGEPSAPRLPTVPACAVDQMAYRDALGRVRCLPKPQCDPGTSRNAAGDCVCPLDQVTYRNGNDGAVRCLWDWPACLEFPWAPGYCSFWMRRC